MFETSPYLDLLKKTLTGTLYPESSYRIDGIPKVHTSIFRPRELLREFRHKLARSLAGPHSILLQKEPPDSEGKNWPLFAYSMIGLKRMDNVQFCIQEILRQNIPGDLLEAGVWRGGCTIFMRALLKEYNIEGRLVWAADSFAGLPPHSPSDHQTTDPNLSRETFLQVSLEQVQKNFATFNLLDDQVRFLKGWFADTLPAAPIQQLALLRLDGDLYSSTRDILHALYHKVSPGGFIIVDDYFSWKGCRKAIDEFRTSHNITTPLLPVDWTCAFWQKK